jgi:DNA-binding PadR family transcriptional regulator
LSTTRLLMLGAVRVFQPVHGYFVRRELMTWRADEWASLNPGSIYNALRTLARDGFIEETGTEASDGRPARTLYRLTDDGETEFLFLLRDALWQLHPEDPSRLMAGVSFMWALSRDEVRAALEHRVAQIEAAHRGLGFSVGDLLSNPSKPRHVAEILRLADARLSGEAEWARGLLERLEAGEYAFAGEPLHQSNLTKPL